MGGHRIRTPYDRGEGGNRIKTPSGRGVTESTPCITNSYSGVGIRGGHGSNATLVITTHPKNSFGGN